MKRQLLTLSLALGLAHGAWAAPILQNTDGEFVEGSAVVLVLTDGDRPAAGVAVKAIHRKNAHATLLREQAIGTTAANGAVSWTPDAAGVVVLEWEGGSANVSVLHDGTPAGGVIVALLAGLLLLGGSALFFLQMLRQPSPEIIEETEQFGEPPST